MYGFLFAGESKTRFGRISGPRHVVNIVTVFQGPDSKIADVEATLDADTSAAVPHGLAGLALATIVVTLLPISFPNAYAKQWRLVSADATNVNLGATAAAGSGVAGSQLRVYIQRPHSIGR